MGALGEVIQNPLARSAAVAGAEALGIVALTTIYNHRELTHNSLKLGRVLRTVARTAMRAIGMNPYVWASVHTVHHSTPDANLVPLLEAADYLEWRGIHSEVSSPPIPDTFAGLDPVAVLSPEQVKDIGSSARKLVENRYDAPDSYSDEEATRLLDPVTPRYLYDERPRFLKRILSRHRTFKEPISNKRSLEYLTPELRDAHSPALHPKGVVGVFFDNVHLYSKDGEHFKDNTNRLPHLQQESSDKIGEKPKWGQRCLIIGNIAVAATMFGSLTLPALAGSVLTGYAMTGLMAAGLRGGGNLTNSFGHGGKEPIKTFLRGVLYKDYKPRPKADGTFAANAKSLSLPTFDEVGGQDEHHENPGSIAYSNKEGFRRFIEAPFGVVLESLANRNIGIRHSEGFGLKPGERRPDEASEAVLKLQDARIMTMQGQLPEKQQAA